MASAFDFRLTTNIQDRSQKTSPQIGETCATVIRSLRGSLTPTKFIRGNKNRILQTYGDYSSSYPDVWDAVEANKKADIWISAPSKNGLYGGVLITKTGSEPLVSGISSISGLNFAAIVWEESIGTGDGLTVHFTKTVDDFAHYTKQTVSIFVAGVTQNVAATDATTEVLSTTPAVGSGTFIRATGVLDFTFTAPATPVLGAAITVKYTVSRINDVYFALFNTAPQADNKADKITFANSIFSTELYEKIESEYYAINGSPFEISLTLNAKNGYGKNIYIEEVLRNNPLFAYKVNTALTVSTFVNDAAKVDFAGGNRGVAITLTELTLGWDLYKNTNTYPADIYFDCTADAGIPALADALVSPTAKLANRSFFILPTPQALASATIATVNGYSINNNNIAFYWNCGYAIDDLAGSRLLTPLMGRVAGKYADMKDVYNGLNPSSVQDGVHNGQLGSGILEMLYDIGADSVTLENMDNANINCIVNDFNYGVMIVSHKTHQTIKSDYSNIGHARLRNYILSNIESQVLPFQIAALNDVTHRAVVKGLAEQIVNPLAGPPLNLLRQVLVVCDETNNTDEVMALEQFILTLKIKFTAFSNYIILNFVNTNQSTDITQTTE
jgi:hypothetical protein